MSACHRAMAERLIWGSKVAALFIAYPAGSGTRFDRDYYVETHLPLVQEAWGPSGLLSGELYVPAKDSSANVAVAVLTFSDEDAIGRALGSPTTPGVMADVANYTDIEPILSRGAAL